MTTLALLAHELRYERRVFGRDPASVVFSVGLPVLYVLIFVTLTGDATIRIDGQPGLLRVSTLQIANFVAVGIVSATFLNLGVKLVQDRESGVLKRLRSTPLPTWAFLGGHVGIALVVAFTLTLVLLVLGFVAYDTPIPGDTLLALALAVVIGAATFASLGFAFTLLVSHESAAAPMVVGSALVLLFLSGNFFQMERAPTLLAVVGEIFPVGHLNDALLTALNPHTTGSGIEWLDLLILAAWGLFGAVVTAQRFRWTPHQR